MPELWLALSIAGLFILPGAALVHLGPWVTDPPMQRLCLSVGLSVAVWPVVFYWLRLVPGLAVNVWGLWFVLGVSLGLLTWRIPKASWRLSGEEWGMVLVILGALTTRFYVIADNVYPAWSDSLHHTLLTEITATTGRLPNTLAPYIPEIVLDQYHLGLYALSGSAQMLSGAPAHSALLWVAQALNACSALGIYFVLDRWVGRRGALVGAMLVSFWSFQPAWYVNWGRFTQLASHVVLPFAWALVIDALRTVRPSGHFSGWALSMIGLLHAGLFELHFRVAVFYVPLVLVSAFTLLTKPWQLWRNWLWLTVTGGVLILPVLIPAAYVYWETATRAITVAPEVAVQSRNIYYGFQWESLFAIGLREWLVGWVALSTLVLFWQHSRLALTMVAWVVILWGVGNAYVLNIPLLNVTNIGAVIIMLYLPAAFLVGEMVERTLRASGRWESTLLRIGGILVLALSVYTGTARATERENYRFFVTPADVQAMQWIKMNTPVDAVFGVNAVFWLPRAPHGTDAGYWIPYLAQRQTTLGVMINNLGGPKYIDKIVMQARAVEALQANPDAVIELRRLGVDYVYIGAQGNFAGQGLNAENLLTNSQLRPVYQADGVWVFQIVP